ncbi:MAG: hypothetical protein R2787_13865 [Saprospiraceae bacterium]
MGCWLAGIQLFQYDAPVTNGPFTVTGGYVSFGLLSNLFGTPCMPNIGVNYASRTIRSL